MQIAIIGCGNMGKAMAQRLSQSNRLFFYDHHGEKSLHLEQEGYGKACQNVMDALATAEMVILAVKPQNLKEVVELVEIRENQIVVSLLAGISLKTLQTSFPRVRIVRMMPNLAILHGVGVIGLSSHHELKGQLQTFESLGKIHWLPEEKMDALTALTGSGPAFFFSIVEAMIEAGIAMGFTAKDAEGLVYQMLQGSLALLEHTKKHPAELRWQIASPQGTTIAGLRKAEELALRGTIMNTFLAAYERALHLKENNS